MASYKRWLFILAVVLQIAFLLGMAAKRVWLLAHGTSVVLPCEPVDPRSLLSGDYVRLRLSISRMGDLSPDVMGTNRAWKSRDAIFVSVAKDPRGSNWIAVGVSATAAEARRKSPVFMKGEVQSGWPLSIRYGTEEYFVPQNEGLTIEKAIRKHSVAVELRVSDSGESAIKRLFIQGKEVRFY